MKKEPKKSKVIEEKPKKSNFYLFIGLFIVLAIAAALVSHYIFPNVNDLPSLQYNGNNFFEMDNGFWAVDLNKYVDEKEKPFRLVLRNSPLEVEDVPILGDPNDFFPSNETYLSFNTELWKRSESIKFSITDLSLKLASTAALLQNGTLFNPLIVCDEDSDDVCKEIGVVNCNSGEKVIEFKENEELQIVMNQNCLTLLAPEEGFDKVVDRLLYYWFGVMEA